MLGPDPDSPRSSWRGGLCERTGPSLYGVAGLSRKIFSKRKSGEKKKTLGGALWGILLQQQLQPLLHPAAWHSRGGVGGIKPKSEASGRVHTMEGSACTRSPEESDCLNLWVRGCWRAGWRLPECWLGTEKSWASPSELAADKNTSKTGLASLKPAGGFFFF